MTHHFQNGECTQCGELRQNLVRDRETRKLPPCLDAPGVFYSAIRHTRNNPLLISFLFLFYCVNLILAGYVGNDVIQQQPSPKTTSIAPSTANPIFVNRLITSIFTVVVNGVPPVMIKNQQLFTPIQWPPNTDETTKVETALTHLATELPKFKPNFFEQFKMEDIHSKTSFLSGYITPTVKVRGTADVVITSLNVATDIVSLAIGALVVFEFKTDDNYADSYTQLLVGLLGVRMASNKPVLAILSDLRTGAIALRICVNETEDNSFYLERTVLTLSEMATLLDQFLKPSLANALHPMKDDSEDADERTASKFLKRRRIDGIAAVQDQLSMFFDLAEDPELPIAYKQQATSNLLHSFGYESVILAIDEAEQAAHRKSHEDRGKSWMSAYT